MFYTTPCSYRVLLSKVVYRLYNQYFYGLSKMFFLALLKRVNLKIVNYFKIHFLFEYKNILHRVRHTSVKDLITSVCWTFMWLEKDDMKQIFCVHAP